MRFEAIRPEKLPPLRLSRLKHRHQTAYKQSCGANGVQRVTIWKREYVGGRTKESDEHIQGAGVPAAQEYAAGKCLSPSVLAFRSRACAEHACSVAVRYPPCVCG